jgi:hypothetical protein
MTHVCNLPEVWELASVEPPWTGTTALYDHITAHIVDGQVGLSEGGGVLPDEKDDGGVRWVAGGIDGAVGHHCGVQDEQSGARMIHRALAVLFACGSSDETASRKLRSLYTLVVQGRTLEYIDPLLEEIVGQDDLDPRRLGAFAVWLAKHAPDREAVKLALGLLGIVPGDHRELIMTLGRHEEFALFAAVALSNDPDTGERDLFDLAQHLRGWGRIQLVERLVETTDPDIKAWMLREGYRNDILYEYLAYTCATVGGLRTALEPEDIDEALLTGAGELIDALICGGPAEDMHDYADGPVVISHYLRHLGPAPNQLSQMLTIRSIAQFIDELDDDVGIGWSKSVRDTLRARCARLLALPQWEPMAMDALASEDSTAFWEALRAAEALGLDAWESVFARLSGGDDTFWYHAMQTDEPKRVDRVVALALKVIGLDAIATGPAEEMGLGLEWAQHSNLGFVLQDLRRFPGKGWPLIRSGLRSPVIRNRHMALRALSPWGRAEWPDEAERLLRQALDDEPTDSVRETIATVLSGGQVVD